MFQIFEVVPLKLLPIDPKELASSLHKIILPLSFIISSIAPSKSSETTKFVILKSTLIRISIWPSKFSFGFLSIFEHSYEYCTINPLFLAFTMHFIILPFSRIDHSLIVVKCSITFGLITLPVSEVEVFVPMY